MIHTRADCDISSLPSEPLGAWACQDPAVPSVIPSKAGSRNLTSTPAGPAARPSPLPRHPLIAKTKRPRANPLPRTSDRMGHFRTEWWGSRDSNPDARRHVILNHARLPVSALPHDDDGSSRAPTTAVRPGLRGSRGTPALLAPRGGGSSGRAAWPGAPATASAAPRARAGCPPATRWP